MRAEKGVACFVLGIFLISLVAAQAFGFYRLQPSQFLESEWFVFVLLFAGIFAVVYFALERWFADRQRGALGVIAFVFAAFGASTIVQRHFWVGRFGDVLIDWFYIGLVIGGILLLFPAASYISRRGGLIASICAVIVALWGIMKFFLNPFGDTLAAQFVWKNNLYWYFDFYNYVIDSAATGVIIFAILGIGILFFLINNRPRRARGGNGGGEGG